MINTEKWSINMNTFAIFSDGTKIYRLLFHKAKNTYSIQDGMKTTLNVSPILSEEEALEFIKNHSNLLPCRYVFMEVE
jgi:hypothetical protein